MDSGINTNEIENMLREKLSPHFQGYTKIEHVKIDILWLPYIPEWRIIIILVVRYGDGNTEDFCQTLNSSNKGELHEFLEPGSKNLESVLAASVEGFKMIRKDKP